jgi:hypothetical protein
MYNDLINASGENRKSSDSLIENEVTLTTTISVLQGRIESMNLELDDKDQVISGLTIHTSPLRKNLRKRNLPLNPCQKKRDAGRALKSAINREIEDIRRQGLSPLVKKKRCSRKRL